jgi:hypothetical protein
MEHEIARSRVEKAENPKQQDDGNWNSNQPEQQTFTHR